MGKAYTGNISSTETEGVIVIAINMFNPYASESLATIKLVNSNGVTRSTIMERALKSKETLFINTKIFITDGDTLVLSGAEFTIAGDTI